MQTHYMHHTEVTIVVEEVITWFLLFSSQTVSAKASDLPRSSARSQFEAQVTR